MKRMFLAMAAMIAVPVATSAQAPAPAPVIDIVEKIKDFGVVPKGEKLQAVFEVKNTGNAPLEISQVRPTCGCTVADFDRTVPVGGVGKVKADVDTTGFSGPNSKAVLVFSNDPSNPQVNLVIKFDVRTFIDVLPRPLLMVNALTGEATTEKVILAPVDGANFKVTEVDTAGRPYETSFRELPEKERLPDRKGSQWEVTVTVPGDAPEGFWTDKLTIRTTAAKAPEVVLTLRATVRPIIQVLPSTEINFGQVPGDAPVGRNLIIVSNRQGLQLELANVQIDDPGFTAEVVPVQAGQKYQVAVTLQAGASKGDHRATLRITTNDPARKLIEVPILAMVQ